MLNQFKEALASFASVFVEMPLSKKVAIGIVGLMMVVGILLTAYLSTGEKYTVLYSGLSGEDTLEITQKLNEKNVKYRLERAGTVVSVPDMDVYQLRLELAGEGLPSGGSIGFEIFDTSSFGMTEFIQNLNYRRALQGELQRTINSMKSVKSSRVHIVIPKRNLFDGDEDKSSASVVLHLKGSGKMGQEQIDAILHLVASSVDGLDPTKITILDTKGNLLSSPEEDDESHRMSVKQHEYQSVFEGDLEKRLRTMLERVLGPGKAVVRVSAKIDFSQTQKTEELYDPNSQVARSEQSSEEKTTGTSLPSGVAGVDSNIPGVTKSEAVFSKPASANKSNSTTNYEINKTVQTTIMPTSVVKKLSVAVLVDGKYSVTKDDKGNDVKEFQPISAEDKTRLENLVKSAIGFDAAREDSVTIESMEFGTSGAFEGIEELASMSNNELISQLVGYGGIALMGIVIFLFVMRPLLAWITKSSSEVDDLRTFPATVRDMEKELSKVSTPEEEKVDFRQKVSDIISNNPEAAANLVRAWLKSRT